MPQSEFERFVQIVDTDLELQRELLAIVDQTQFVTTVAQRAAQHGIVIAQAELWEAMGRGRNAWLAAQTP